jgi:hypothetical protein
VYARERMDSVKLYAKLFREKCLNQFRVNFEIFKFCFSCFSRMESILIALAAIGLAPLGWVVALDYPIMVGLGKDTNNQLVSHLLCTG